MNDVAQPSTTAWRFAAIPLEEFVQLLADVGLALLERTLERRPLRLGEIVEEAGDGQEILRHLASFQPVGEPVDSPQAESLRSAMAANKIWMKLDAAVWSETFRRWRMRRFSRRLLEGRLAADAFGMVFRSFLRQRVCVGAGCAIPVSLWATCGAAAWTNLAFQQKTTDVIHHWLRSRICHFGRWEKAPNLHPNTFWLLIRLASPAGQPQRMLHVLREHAGRSLREPAWARFWDQWVAAEALSQTTWPTSWATPRCVRSLPYVIERKGGDPAEASSPLTAPNWNDDRPEYLTAPWPPLD